MYRSEYTILMNITRYIPLPHAIYSEFEAAYREVSIIQESDFYTSYFNNLVLLNASFYETQKLSKVH